MTYLGDQVQIRRESKGWSRGELARRSGVTDTAIRRLETGVRKDCTTATVCELAGALGTPPDALLLPGYALGRQLEWLGGDGVWRPRLGAR